MSATDRVSNGIEDRESASDAIQTDQRIHFKMNEITREGLDVNGDGCGFGGHG